VCRETEGKRIPGGMAKDADIRGRKAEMTGQE